MKQDKNLNFNGMAGDGVNRGANRFAKNQWSGHSNDGRLVNKGRGPTVGNAGMGTKRKDFMAEKVQRSSEKAKLAGMITDALESRGRDNRSTRRVGVESLHSMTNVGRGPTRGNAGRK